MNYIETGEIVTVFGIKGEVKVYPWADYPEFLEEFDTFYIQKNRMKYEAMEAESVRTRKNMVIIKFAGINDVDTARKLVGKTLYLDRDEIELEEGSRLNGVILGVNKKKRKELQDKLPVSCHAVIIDREIGVKSVAFELDE